MRLKLLLAYEGTAYSGWQIQEKRNPPATIQGAVETALFALCGVKIRVFGAGRTDAGVHARGQVAHCDVPDGLRYEKMDWRKAMNAALPRDIRVLAAGCAKPDFHARKSAIAKTYIYQFWQERAFTPPHLRRYVWSCGPLRLEPMLEAARVLKGEHDFVSFQNAGSDVSGTIRRISGISLAEQPLPEYFPKTLPMLRLCVTANGFLKQMTRNIAGCLAWVGMGKLKAGDVAVALQAASRQALPSPTAPACGLALAFVDYDQEGFWDCAEKSV